LPSTYNMVIFTTPSSVLFNYNQTDLLQVIIIVSTKCCFVSNHHPEHTVHYKGQSCVTTGTGDKIVFRLSISYDYRHDLNSFSKQFIDNHTQNLGSLDNKATVLVEE
jgi:hypothetical protein